MCIPVNLFLLCLGDAQNLIAVHRISQNFSLSVVLSTNYYKKSEICNSRLNRIYTLIFKGKNYLATRFESMTAWSMIWVNQILKLKRINIKPQLSKINGSKYTHSPPYHVFFFFIKKHLFHKRNKWMYYTIQMLKYTEYLKQFSFCI